MGKEKNLLARYTSVRLPVTLSDVELRRFFQWVRMTVEPELANAYLSGDESRKNIVNSWRMFWHNLAGGKLWVRMYRKYRGNPLPWEKSTKGVKK